MFITQSIWKKETADVGPGPDPLPLIYVDIFIFSMFSMINVTIRFLKPLRKVAQSNKPATTWLYEGGHSPVAGNSGEAHK